MSAGAVDLCGLLDGAWARGVLDRLAGDGVVPSHFERALDLPIGWACGLGRPLAPEELALLRLVDRVPGLVSAYEFAVDWRRR